MREYVQAEMSRKRNGHVRLVVSWVDRGAAGVEVKLNRVREEPIGPQDR